MKRAALLVAVLIGCPPPARYREVRPGLDCERATRVAYRTMMEIGYAVTEVVPARPDRAGVVAGTKTLSDGSVTSPRVVITCDGGGAVLQPIEDAVFPDYEFSRVFGYSFKALVQRPDTEEPRAAVGLQVLVRRIPPEEALLDLGGPTTAGGAVLVRVTVRNNTDRAIAIDPGGIELVPPGGRGAAPLAGAALAGALAPGPGGDRVRAEPLRAGRIGPATTVTGFLVYPAGQYREARLGIEDVETGEGEGFVTPVE